ncbi:MAG: hypothetical protein ABJN69_13075 [Hellea sp.]
MLTQSDIARISRILQKTDCSQPIEGVVSLENGALTLRFNAPQSRALDAQRALMAHHLNTDIDPQNEEARVRDVNGIAVLELDVKAPLWKHSEKVPPSEVVLI